MDWGTFWTYVIQAIIVVFLLFAICAGISVVREEMRKSGQSTLTKKELRTLLWFLDNPAKSMLSESRITQASLSVLLGAITKMRKMSESKTDDRSSAEYRSDVAP